MRLIMLGANHRTCGVEVRERLAFPDAQAGEALAAFCAAHPRAEAALLSTCNRTELYIAAPEPTAPTHAQLVAFLAHQRSLDVAEVERATAFVEGQGVASHLFRVACGLDSMVLGEPQVLGQVKRAYELSCTHAAAGAAMHHLFQEAIGAAKRVRRETGIDEGRLSVGSVAVDLVRQVFSRFDDKSVLAIGAGQMMKVTLRHVRALSPARLWLVNRTPSRAQALAQALELPRASGEVVRPWEDLGPLLAEADIVISSTGATRPIVTAEGFRPVARRRRGRPLCIIDIAVPRDFEPGVGEFNDVYLYNIDDLQRVVAQTQDQRRSQAQRAEELLEVSVRACVRHLQHDDVGRIVRKLRHLLHDLGRAECERTARKLAAEGAPGAQPHIEELTHRLINKVLHLPLSKLRGREGDEHLDFYALALRRLFELDAVEVAEGEPKADAPADLPAADAKPLS